MRNSILHQKSYAFALPIIALCKHLTEDKKEYILSKQVLRSGTSIGAMIRESEFWQSRADFYGNYLSDSRKQMRLSTGYLYFLIQDI